jgi:hypothetical protein
MTYPTSYNTQPFVLIVIAAIVLSLAAAPARASNPTQAEPNAFTFQQLRLDPITLTGPLSSATVQVGLPAHWSPSGNAQLRLSFSTASPGFQELRPAESVSGSVAAGAASVPLRQAGNLRVSWNGAPLANVPLNSTGSRAVAIDIPARVLSATQPGAAQALSFQLEDLEQCGKNEQTRIVIQPNSALVVPHQVVPVPRDLRLLPFPLQQRSFAPDEVVIVVPDQPTAEELQAAFNVAAGLGRMTQGKLVLNLTTVGALDEATRSRAHLILIGKPASMSLLTLIQLPLKLSGNSFEAATPDNGVLQMAESPWNPQRVVLVVSGASDAGTALAGKGLGSGDVRASRFTDLALISGEPAAQAPNINLISALDTPLANFGYGEVQLRGPGRQIASYTFSLPEGQLPTAGAYFQASYVHSALIDADRSSLTVLLNGSRIGSLSLGEDSTRLAQAQVVLPQDGLHAGENHITLEADVQPRDPCALMTDDLWISLRNDSLLHLPLATQESAAPRKVSLTTHLGAMLSQPNLSNQLFVVGPDDARGWVLAARLAYGLGAQQLGSTLEKSVGFSDVGAAFSTALPEAAVKQRDVIVVGKASALRGMVEALNRVLPASFPAENDVAVERDAALQYRAPEGADIGYVQLAQSPWSGGRSVLAVMGSSDAGLVAATNALLQADKRAQISGNLAYINGEQIVAKDSQAVMSSSGSSNAAGAISTTTNPDGVRFPAQPAVVPGQAGTPPTWLVPVIAVSIGVLLLVLALAAITSISRRRR